MVFGARYSSNEGGVTEAGEGSVKQESGWNEEQEQETKQSHETIDWRRTDAYACASACFCQPLDKIAIFGNYSAFFLFISILLLRIRKRVLAIIFIRA